MATVSTRTVGTGSLDPLSALVGIGGRLALTLIFWTSALMNKIPNFQGVAQYMGSEGVPAPQVMLAGAIAFLLLGSASIIFGFRPRFGAALLAIFLILATYYFHDFWNLPADAPQEKVMSETINFLKNVGLLGAMLLIMSQGLAGWTVDAALARRPATAGHLAS